VPSEVELFDLGTALPDNQGVTTFTFDIDPGTTSFALSAQPDPGGLQDQVILVEVTGPNGLLTQVDLQTGQTFGPFVTPFSNIPNAAFSLLYPNTPTLEVEPGPYSVSFFAVVDEQLATSSRATLMTKKAESPPLLGSLTLDIWFADNAMGLTAGSAPNDPDFQAALEEMQTIYDNAGLTIADVAYRDVGIPQLGIIDDNAELSQLFAIPDTERNGRIALFIVESIDLTQQGVILGVASGAPGPASVATAPHAGVAVSTFGFMLSPERVGKTMAHEVGHFLGLDHTTESDGISHDPIPDTPECTQTQMGVAFPELCPTGAANFMFWTGFQDNREQQDVSPGQRQVMNGNPAIAQEAP